ncbi:T9SS type A sorting domain-containing protein [Crocinitomicaceae bacterium]|nr:T9SS type A sorting domain-containing protein [Crocinitomicaceae bacterium]
MRIKIGKYYILSWVIGYFLITQSVAYGQYLNQVIETTNTYEYSYNWNYEANNLVGIYTYQDSNWLQSGWSGLEFKSYDENLNLLNSAKYYDVDYNYWSGWSVAFDGENYYYVGGKEDILTSDTITAYLIKFNPQGDVLWEKNFYTNSRRSWAVYCVYRDDSLYISGNIRDPITDDIETFMFSADTSGQMGWDRIIANNSPSNVSLDTTQDGGFLLSVFRQYGINDPTTIYKLDSLGNTEWERQLTFPNGEHVLSATEMPDGNVLCYGHSDHPIYTTKRSWLVKLDNMGNVLQDTVFDFSEGYDIFGNPNNVLFYGGEFQIIGGKYDNLSSNTAKLHLLRFDFDLNILWRREYNARLNENVMGLQKKLNNGFTFLAGSVSQDANNETGDQWFMVVDSLGCVSPNCVLGIEENETSVFTIYPNPSKGEITISLNSTIEPTTIELLDMNGRVLTSIPYSQKVSFNQETGIYLLRLKSGEGEIGTTRIALY